MEIYAISDLHLSYGVDKPMNIFGTHWENYEEKIKQSWENTVKEEDYVIIAGDLSWAINLKEAEKDFEFLDKLPGKKIILKGNHDYWWETVTKMRKFLKEKEYNSIMFLHNNCIETDKYLICGTRYWGNEEESNEKIINRECERLKISLENAKQTNENKPIIAVTHYPPDDRIIEIAQKYNVKKWVYGHIHSNYENSIIRNNDIEMYLTSCDYLNFKLINIK